jgi:uncharacterized protein (DUF1684 family)
MQRKRMLVSSLAILLTVSFMIGCGGDRFDPEAYRTEIETWQQGREERLSSESGWLTLVGLFWLQPGENGVGSGDKNVVVLSAGPDSIATMILEDGEVRLEPVAGSGLMIGDEPATARILGTDNDEETDTMTLGNLLFYIVERGDRFGVRVKDSQSPVRTGFQGLDRYEIDPAWRVEGRWTAYDPPKEIPIASVIGTVETMLGPGHVTFEFDGQSYALDPVDAGDEYWYLFRDKTSGDETYGAGRYLYGPKEDENGRVIIDFNRAYNPPCAFTAFATCPLPPLQNRLDLRVEAGEKKYGEH